MKFVSMTALAAVCMRGAAAFPPPAGSYAASSGNYNLGGFVCGNKSPTCKIWYPKDLDKGPFPIVTAGHGIGGEELDNLYESIASLGMVVVFPATGRGACDESDDMLHAIDGSKKNTSLHEALGHVDWSRAGVFGHLMGAAATISVVLKAQNEPQRYNLKAAVISHPYRTDASASTSQFQLPAMFVTGGEDRRSNVKKDFDACAGRPKVIAEVDGAMHMEPSHGGRMNPFDAHFLGCHVAGIKPSCDKIYGKEPDDMCQANTMKQCQVVQDTYQDVIV